MKFKNMLNYKFNWYKPDCEGLVTVNPKETSKKCHHCQHVVNELPPSVRQWTCPDCEIVLDRDINAAINILNHWNNGDRLSTRC